MKIRLIYFVLLVACLLSSCKWQDHKSVISTDKSSSAYVDDLGRNIKITRHPQRIISLAPSITEIMFALDLTDRVVGVTSYCDFPSEAKTKEKVGDTLKPNLERIVALKPDLILISTASQLEKITRQLDQYEIPVFVTNPQTVPDVIRSIRIIGEITDSKSRAEELASSLEQRLDRVQKRASEQSSPRVLYVLQFSPLITAGKNTFINDLISRAGGKSISGEESTDYPQFSRETVIARAPEIIIIPESHGSELIRPEAINEIFAATPAVENKRIIKVNPDLIDRPGPRIIDGLEALEAAIHEK